MPCTRCPKWVTSKFKCAKCGFEFTYRHRDKGEPVSHLKKKSYKCNNCTNIEFIFIGAI